MLSVVKSSNLQRLSHLSDTTIQNSRRKMKVPEHRKLRQNSNIFQGRSKLAL
ncbi:UDP-N-acetylglucosamine--N-acetylmuramyl [Sesbania bispinosa]|nr:UDP-N-acetylglucosamine--N-acetylmuramyl [Sesbania bispinosa]